MDFVALDIKLPEHFNPVDETVLDRELESLANLLEKTGETCCKLVVMPKTDINTVKDISKRLSSFSKDISLVIQPSSPIEDWEGNESKILEFSKVAGIYLDVLTIPQLHKCMHIP
jgi:organic radical activating enzyme